MPEYQLLTCNIALAGDLMNIVARHAHRPVTYPELIVLEFLHGENSITDVFECGYTEERDAREEKARLVNTYGPVVELQLFPGHNIQMPVSNAKFKPRLIGTLVNPAPPIPAEPPMEIDPDIVAAAARQMETNPEIVTGAARQRGAR
jgi:hypothetical protein